MHLRSREEINLIRLLSRCEEMAAQKQVDWRLEQYVQSLKEKLADLKKLDSSVKPKDDVMKEYQQKIIFLCQFISASSLPKTAEKSLANEFLTPSNTKTIASNPNVPSGKQIQMKTSAKYEQNMKEELFSTSSKPSSSAQQDVDVVLQHQHKMQEKLAEEMVAITRNLKHNIIASNQIIKSDIKVINESIKQTDVNYDKLHHETNRLDKHLQKKANWWLWISIALVCFIFIGMIVFIRFFPKF